MRAEVTRSHLLGQLDRAAHRAHDADGEPPGTQGTQHHGHARQDEQHPAAAAVIAPDVLGHRIDLYPLGVCNLLHRLAVHQKAGLVLGVRQLGGAFAVACGLQLVDRAQMRQHRLARLHHIGEQLLFLGGGEQLAHLRLHRVDRGDALGQVLLEVRLVLAVGGLGHAEGIDDARAQQVRPPRGEALLDQRLLDHDGGGLGHGVQTNDADPSDQRHQQQHDCEPAAEASADLEVLQRHGSTLWSQTGNGHAARRRASLVTTHQPSATSSYRQRGRKLKPSPPNSSDRGRRQPEDADRLGQAAGLVLQ
jgi:hypothetical protein